MAKRVVVFILILALLVTGCAPHFKLTDQRIETLALCPRYQAYIDEDIRKEFETILEEVQQEYDGDIRLTPCDEQAPHKLRVYFENTDISGSKERKIALAISIPGTILPIALILLNSPIWFPIWWIPFNTSNFKMDLESSAEEYQVVVGRAPRSISISGPRSKQIATQKRKVKKEIIKTIKRIEENNRRINQQSKG